MNKELRECPFCGKPDKVIMYTYSMTHCDKVLWTRYGVKCKRCNFEIPVCAKKATAIRKWNTRPAEGALVNEVERLKAALSDISKIAFEPRIGDRVARETMRRISNNALNKEKGE